MASRGPDGEGRRATSPLTGDAGGHRPRSRLSLRAQLVWVTALLAAVVALGLVIVVQLTLEGAARGSSEQILGDRADTLVRGINQESTSSLVVPVEQLDPGVAVYDARGRRVAGSEPESMAAQFRELATVDRPRTIDTGEEFALHARPFSTAHGQHGVVVVAESLAPYERRERSLLILSLVAGALLVLTAAGSAAWISRRVLAPVRRMARTADEWSEHDLERRFDLGPPTNEISALGHTLDALLEKVATAIRSEQRLTSELAHELRTPLTSIRGVAQLAAMDDRLDLQAQQDLALITVTCDSMAHTIDVLLDLARRSAPDGRDRTEMAELRGVVEALPLREARFELDLPDGLRLLVPPELAGRALAPVLDNAMRLGRTVRLSASATDHRVELRVADDGPGVADDERDALFVPGRSGTGGSGLGLSLARRIARSGGGEVELETGHNAAGGATFLVTLPGGLPPASH